MIRHLMIALVLAPLALQAQRTRAPLVAQLPTLARSAALGGLTAGTADAEGVLVNPALAGSSTTAAATLVRYRPGTAGAVVASSSVIGRFGIGLAASYLDYQGGSTPGAPVTDDVLVVRGVEPSASLRAALGISTTFKGLRWGASATYLEERAGLDRASVLAGSVGASTRAGPVAVGLAVQDVGPSMEFGTTRVDLPSRVALGLSGTPIPIGAWLDLQVDVGMAMRFDGRYVSNGGAELAWTPIEGFTAALRGGVRRAELERQGPVTGGFGVTLDRFSLDYAWESLDGGSGGAHRVGVRIR